MGSFEKCLSEWQFVTPGDMPDNRDFPNDNDCSLARLIRDELIAIIVDIDNLAIGEA